MTSRMVYNELYPICEGLKNYKYTLTSFIVCCKNHFYNYFRMVSYEGGWDWYKVDDTDVQKVGGWLKVISSWIKNNWVPTLLIYERIWDSSEEEVRIYKNDFKLKFQERSQLLKEALKKSQHFSLENSEGSNNDSSEEDIYEKTYNKNKSPINVKTMVKSKWIKKKRKIKEERKKLEKKKKLAYKNWSSSSKLNTEDPPESVPNKNRKKKNQMKKSKINSKTKTKNSWRKRLGRACKD